MNPKQLTCMDEELSIEIAKPKGEAQELIITVSMTRIYLIANPLDIIGQNGDRMEVSGNAHLTRSLAI